MSNMQMYCYGLLMWMLGSLMVSCLDKQWIRAIIYVTFAAGAAVGLVVVS